MSFCDYLDGKRDTCVLGKSDTTFTLGRKFITINLSSKLFKCSYYIDIVVFHCWYYPFWINDVMDKKNYGNLYLYRWSPQKYLTFIENSPVWLMMVSLSVIMLVESSRNVMYSKILLRLEARLGVNYNSFVSNSMVIRVA